MTCTATKWYKVLPHCGLQPQQALLFSICFNILLAPLALMAHQGHHAVYQH